MTAIIIISILTVAAMVSLIILLPKITIGKISLSTYWMAPLTSAAILLISRIVNWSSFWSALTSSSAINPLEILILFISITSMSIMLDEVGFFEFLASYILKKVHRSQISLFLSIYVLISVLTIFTSNDIIILTFTPFLIFFAKNAKINPVPYIFAEFVAANSWSLLLIIGNPTNIYLATSFGIGFFAYVKVMWLPALLTGLVSFILLFLIFHKSLKKPIESTVEQTKIKNRPIFVASFVCLCSCTILLAVSSYVGFPMWLIALVGAAVLFIFAVSYSFFYHPGFKIILSTIKRSPWDIIPFVLSMFVLVLGLKQCDVTSSIASFFSDSYPILKYGLASLLTANAVNNIPMSVLFTEIILSAPSSIQVPAMYAAIAGSNICAYLTPLGALAGIMWMSIVKKYGIKFSFLTFIKYGALISFASICAAMLGLFIVFGV